MTPIQIDSMIDNITDGVQEIVKSYSTSNELMSDERVQAGLRAVFGDAQAYGTENIPQFMRKLASGGIIQKVADRFRVSLKSRGESSADEAIVMNVLASLRNLIKGSSGSPGLDKLSDIFAFYGLDDEEAVANAALGPVTALADTISNAEASGKFYEMDNSFSTSGKAGAGAAKIAKQQAVTKVG